MIGHQKSMEVANIERCIARCAISFLTAREYASGMCHPHSVSTNAGKANLGLVRVALMFLNHPCSASDGASPTRTVSGIAQR